IANSRLSIIRACQADRLVEVFTDVLGFAAIGHQRLMDCPRIELFITQVEVLNNSLLV
ncbi:hypothetical protein LTR28_009176, partial [Elasticomyces elasticus]